MYEEAEERVSVKLDWNVWRRLLPYLRPVRGQMLFAAVLMVVSAAVDTAIPLFTSYAVNHFVELRTTDGIGRFALVYVTAIVIQTLTTVLFSRLCMVIEMETGRRMKRDCFVHLQRLPISYYNHTSVGYILARVMSDTSRLCGMISWGMINALWNLFYLLGILAAMFLLHVKLALIVTCVVPVVILLTRYFQPKLLKANADMRHANSRITTSFNENISGSMTSKTLVIEEKNCGEFRDIAEHMYSASLRSARLTAVYVPAVSFVGSLAVALVIGVGGDQLLNGNLNYGTLAAFISYGLMILDPLYSLTSMIAELMSAQVNLQRVSKLLDEPVTLDDSDAIKAEFGDVFHPNFAAFPKMHGEVTFDHVWFRYPDAAEDDYVLEDVSFHIPAGSTVALVGETGAGKSTTVNLICRFFEATRGTVKIDGEDIRKQSLSCLHSNLGYVQQTPQLFSGTLLENIRYGNLTASDEAIQKAAELVAVDQIAAKLENGYNTDIGENGDRLSTGEKQLVSFARAIATDPPLFILDEATSSIDTETEQMIQGAIRNVLQGRTSFIIAHRLSTIRSADVIFFVKGKGIAEAGTHDALMAAHGNYYKLYTAMANRKNDGLFGFEEET